MPKEQITTYVFASPYDSSTSSTRLPHATTFVGSIAISVITDREMQLISVTCRAHQELSVSYSDGTSEISEVCNEFFPPRCSKSYWPAPISEPRDHRTDATCR